MDLEPLVSGGVESGKLATDFARDLDLPLVFTLHSHYDVYARRYAPIVPKLAGLVVEEIVKRYLDKCTHIVAPTPHIRDLFYTSTRLTCR